MTFEIPSRDRLTALRDAASGIVPAVAVGFVHQLDGDRVGVMYSYAHGVGGFELPTSGVPDALAPAGDNPSDAGPEALAAHSTRALEAFLRDNKTERVVSLPLRGVDPPTRFWVGLADPAPLTMDQWQALEALAADGAALITARPSHEQLFQRLNRLEEAAGLIPALLHVLDVREVIDRLSTAARRALPHDLLLLNLFSDDLSTFTVYARSDQGAGLGRVMPNVYPASTIQAWTFSIIDDHLLHPFERDSPATKAGARSSLRFPIRFDDRVIGGVSFVSFGAFAFSGADVPIGKRLSEHVASAISHFTLAGRLAEEAKRTEELRAQKTNLELLDALLATLIESADLSGAFEQISSIAAKVLRHDAMLLMVRLPDGVRGRVYASAGFPSPPPPVTPIPKDVLENPDWEYDIADDLALRGERGAPGLRMGFHSLLRVPVRLDGALAGALGFFSKAVAGFKQSDILVARRMADRMALALAHNRELEAGRRADEATERAARLEARVRALTDELDARTGYRRVVGDSLQWRQVLTQATQVAATETTALLLGESGTGKEVIARFLHRASPRSHGPFVALNCAALPEQLLEAELFGYERGAFTGATQSKPGQLEQAAGGTLFLDEVAEMSPPAQAKFLRVLQEREFQRLGGTRILRTDARIVAATNRDLQKAIVNGHFREDLFYRLNVFAIRLPPLRERKDDILPLTQAFLSEFGRAFANPPAGISREAKQMLLAYRWPGNIRELRNILERAAILCDGGLITDDHLALPIEAPTAPRSTAGALVEARASSDIAPPPILPLPISDAPPSDASRDLATVERTMIEEALRASRFNKSKAAKELGLTRHQLYIRMKRHGLEN